MRIIQAPWLMLRDAVVADDTALTTFDYDSWPTANTIAIGLGQPSGLSELADFRQWVIAFYGTAAENRDAGYKLYSRRKVNGPILLLASGVLTLGAQLITKTPIGKVTSTQYWADTITVTGGLWYDLAPLVIDPGNDRIALLRGVNDGLAGLYCEIDLDGGPGTACASVSAIITGTEDV